MVTVPELWLPVLLSAVLVFAVSSLIHVVLAYHAGDSRPLPDEAKVMEPRPFTNPLGEGMLISFVVGPDGVRIEIVQPRV